MRRHLLATVVLLAVFALCWLLLQPAAAQNNEWGALKGQVVLVGKVPAPQKLNVNKDEKHCLSKGDIYTEEWVVNPKTMGVRWVFVSLEPDKGGPPLKVHPSLTKPKSDEVFMDQPCCKFEPHALAVREGQKLVVKNSAPIAHNVHTTGHPLKNPGINVIVPAGKSHTIDDLKADRFSVTVQCDIHGWMKAYVRVYNHPYFAVTDADGKFEIKDAPAGTYRLVTWHDSGYGPGGRDGIPITIKGGAVSDTKVELKPQQ